MAIPVFHSAYINNHNPYELVLSYTGTLDASSIPSGSDFSVSGGRTVTNVQITSSTYVNSYVMLTLNNKLSTGWATFGESITVGYTAGANPLKNADGNCTNLTNEAVDNRVKDPTPIVEDVSVIELNPKLWRVVLNRPCETIAGCWIPKINGVTCTGITLSGYGTGSLFIEVNESASYGDVLTLDFDTNLGFCTAIQEMYMFPGTPSMVSFTGKVAINKLPNPTPDRVINQGWNPSMSSTIQPGETVLIQGGFSGGMFLGGVRGTYENPVKIVFDGVVSISAGGANGFTIGVDQTTQLPSQHFVVCGGTEVQPYKLEAQGYYAVEFPYCTDFEAYGIYVTSAGYAGITARTNVGCTGNWSKFDWFPKNYHIHDCKIRNTGGEGFYVGASHWGSGQNGQPGCVGVLLWESEHTGFTRLYNNDFDQIGLDGLQYGSCVENCEVFDNRITNFATSNTGGHSSGIQINGGSTGLLYRNFISGGPRGGFSAAIFDSGVGLQTVFNNIIENVYLGAYVSDNGTPINGAFNRWYNNTIFDTTIDTIVVPSSLKANDFKDNILVLHGVGYDYITNAGGSFTESNNLKTQDISTVLFTDYINDDFTLQAGSPAKGAATNLDIYGVYNDDQGATDVETIPPTNIPPNAIAGSDQEITLPTSQVTLDGSASSDSDGTIASYAWSKISGGAATITSPANASTTVTGLEAGVYLFRLTVTDDGGSTDTDDVTITVNAQGLPDHTGTTWGTSDLYLWRQRAISGPYKVSGDSFADSPAAYTEILARADVFVADPSTDYITGDPGEEVGNGGVYVGLKGNGIMSAAFVYLITGDTTYGNAAKDGIVAQCNDSAVDWTAIAAGDTFGNNIFVGHWLIRLFNGFEYIKPLLSVGELSVVESWFDGGATWSFNTVNTYLAQNFPNRLSRDYSVRSGTAAIGSTAIAGNKNPNSGTGEAYAWTDDQGGFHNIIMEAHARYCNRTAALIEAAGLWAIYRNNTTWIDYAKLYFEEWLKFGVYSDGSQAEWNRNGENNNGRAGLGTMYYATINLECAIVLCDAMRRKGDSSWFTYTTSDGLDFDNVYGQYGSSGGNKNLRLVIQTYAECITQEVPRYWKEVLPANLIDPLQSNNTQYPFDLILGLANQYYKEQTLKDVYKRNSTAYPGITQYNEGVFSSAAGNGWVSGGPIATFPAFNFMYAENELIDSGRKCDPKMMFA